MYSQKQYAHMGKNNLVSSPWSLKKTYQNNCIISLKSFTYRNYKDLIKNIDNNKVLFDKSNIILDDKNKININFENNTNINSLDKNKIEIHDNDGTNLFGV